MLKIYFDQRLDTYIPSKLVGGADRRRVRPPPEVVLFSPLPRILTLDEGEMAVVVSVAEELLC